MNYHQTLDYLYTQLPMFTRIGAVAYKADLSNTIALCSFLDHPEKKFKSIHIAGTNGKGSTSHLLASVLQEAGYKTGLYTSPHIKDFRERIKINGVKIDEQFVIDFTENIKTQITDLQPSFFELTVAMCFDYFATKKVDIAIIEVGLGGLLDSTNVITPELCIITNIGLDHTNLLGNTYAEIATQKAGIIKPNIPTVISQTQDETEIIFTNKALKKNAPIVFADKVLDVVAVQNTSFGLQNIKVVDKAKMTITPYAIDLLGNYQHKNIKGVLMGIEILQQKNWLISPDNIKDGLQFCKKNTGLMARFDVLETKPMLICDAAHNAEGMQEVLAQINNITYEKLHIIMGFVADKAIDKVLQLLPKTATYYCTQANIPRALPKEILLENIKDYKLIGQTYLDVNDALQSAKSSAKENDIILICGSFFVIAELEDYYN